MYFFSLDSVIVVISCFRVIMYFAIWLLLLFLRLDSFGFKSSLGPLEIPSHVTVAIKNCGGLCRSHICLIMPYIFFTCSILFMILCRNPDWHDRGIVGRIRNATVWPQGLNVKDSVRVITCQPCGIM